MKRKYYYVDYYKDFGNTYWLYWSYDPNLGLENDELKRITREKAIDLCVAERYRQKHDRSMSGFASSTIKPYGCEKDFDYGESYWLNGYIWEAR